MLCSITVTTVIFFGRVQPNHSCDDITVQYIIDVDFVLFNFLIF